MEFDEANECVRIIYVYIYFHQSIFYFEIIYWNSLRQTSMLELYIYVYFIRVFLIWDNIFEFDEVNEIVRIIYILYQRIFNCDNIFEFDEANECVRIIYIYIYIYVLYYNIFNSDKIFYEANEFY